MLPRSRVLLKTNIPPLFERIFVCFHGSATGFESGYRPFLRFDGCYLKGPYGGILVVAIGWKLFPTQLKGPLSNVLETKKLTIISNRQKVSYFSYFIFLIYVVLLYLLSDNRSSALLTNYKD